MKTLIVKDIDPKIYNDFKAKCAEKGKSIRETIIDFMNKFAGNHND